MPNLSNNPALAQTVAAAQLAASLGLGPEPIWTEFARLTRIPRESGNETEALNQLKGFAQQQGFSYRQDQAGNLVISVPGRGTGIGKPTVVLQAHIDMVCVKEDKCAHDFALDAIKLQIEQRNVDGVAQRILTADGTTLGADNGIGLAAAVSLAYDPDVKNSPPLEILVTTEEEVGLKGAKQLDPSLLTGRLLINLDTEEYGCVYVSSAGSRDLVADIVMQREAVSADDTPILVRCSGLKGGHSGLEIHTEVGNANIILAEALENAGVGSQQQRIAAMKGGSRRNVIPSDAEALIWVPKSQAAALAQLAADPQFLAGLQQSIADPANRTLKFEVLPADPATTPLPVSEQQSLALLQSIRSLTNGVIAWSPHVADLVETSSSMGVLRTDDSHLQLICMTRSSKDGAVDAAQNQMESMLVQHGWRVGYENTSPGWEADPQNPLLPVAEQAFRQVTGNRPHIKAVHAGLECGAFRAAIPDIKMVSIGPDIRGAHTTEEFAVIDTVSGFRLCLISMLEALSK